MSHHGTLGVATEHNLGVGALGERSCYHGLHGGSSIQSQFDISQDGSIVINALHGDLVGAEGRLQGSEERWAGNDSYVSGLKRSTCKDDCDLFAADVGGYVILGEEAGGGGRSRGLGGGNGGVCRGQRC